MDAFPNTETIYDVPALKRSWTFLISKGCCAMRKNITGLG
jgi:hypothetical protein